MKNYTITVTFTDGGTHSRVIEAHNKKDAENEFFVDLDQTVRDHIQSYQTIIQKKGK